MEDFSSGCSSGLRLGQFGWREFFAHGLIAILLFPTTLMAAQLASPDLYNPTELNCGKKIEFSWSKVEDANTYRLQVARSNFVADDGKNCSKCVLNEKVNSGTQFSSSLDSGIYFWRVRAGNLDSTKKLQASEWTTPKSVSVVEGEKIVSPTLSYPIEGSVLNDQQPIRFRWGKVDCGDYRLQVAHSSDFQVSSNGKDCSNCLLNKKVDKDNKFSSSLMSGKHFWRIRAGNLDSDTKLQASEWTTPQSFSVTSNTADVYKLQRTTIGQALNKPVRWEIKDVESDTTTDTTEITLCINNLKTGKITVEPASVKKVKDVYEVTHDFSEKYGEAIYAVAAVSKGSDCNLESVRNQAIVQIVGPETTEKSPTFNKCDFDTTYDVIVIDGTSAGIAAAYTAAKKELNKKELNTCLLESTSLLGGMLTNGIGNTDISFYQFIKCDKDRRYLSYGLMDELRQKVVKEISKISGTNKDFLLEKTTKDFGGKTPDDPNCEKDDNAISGLDYTPSVIRQALYDLLEEQKENLSITLDAPFLSVKKESDYYIVETANGSSYKGKYLVDATDSGDVAVALSKELGRFKDDRGYCANLNKRKFDKKFTPAKGLQVTQDNVPTTIPVDKIPTFCLRNPTQAYSFVMTLEEYDNEKNKNWSYMETPPPNCFANRQGIEGEYTNDFFTDDNNHWSVNSGLMGVDPVMFQVKHHTTIDMYDPKDYRKEGHNAKDSIKCLVDNKTNQYKQLGDELIDCNAHGVEGLPTGYADKANDIDRLPIVDRYLNHTMCFLYNMQHHSGGTIKSDWTRGRGDKSLIASQIGLTSNEDPLRGNFPARMYVREGRRINGLQTFTGKDAQNAYYDQPLLEEVNKKKKEKPNGLLYLKNHAFNNKGRPNTGQVFGKHYTEELKLERPVEKLKRSIAITTYGMDSHSVNLDEPGDGKIPPYQMNLITGPGAIPFGVMVPRSLATENILVPLAASAGTWGQSVMRMEPTRLSMGQAAAVAIKIAKEKGKNFQQFTKDEDAIFELQKRLISQYGEKIYLYLDDSFYPEGTHKNENHMIAQFLGVWGIASGKNLSKPYQFGPKDQVTRAEIAKMIVKTRTDLLGESFEKLTPRDVSTLTDVSEALVGDLYQPIKTLYEAGIVRGYSDNRFAPNQNVTRGELSKFVVKGILGVGDEFTFVECKKEKTVNGQTKCVAQPWITAYLNCAIKNDLLKEGTNKETDKATRMEAARAVYNAYLLRRNKNFDAKTFCSK